MTELIKITEQNGNQAVSAKELHQFLGSNEQFGKWINRMFSYGYTQGVDYEQLALLVPTANGGSVQSKDYILTLDTAKEISMLQRSKRGRQIRRYFIEVEKKARQNTLHVPRPLNIHGMEAVSYDHWLLANGYSVSSGQRNRRIAKHREHFHRHASGRWYISTAFANALLNYRDGHKKLQMVEALPGYEQLTIF